MPKFGSLLIFCVNTHSLGDIITWYGFKYHRLAHNSQNYIFCPDKFPESQDFISNCLFGTFTYMYPQKSILCYSKLNFQVYTQNMPHWHSSSSSKGNCFLSVVYNKNHGIIFDASLFLISHIQSISKILTSSLKYIQNLTTYHYIQMITLI